MKHRPLKLACIVALAYGGLVPPVVDAVDGDVPSVATGSIDEDGVARYSSAAGTDGVQTAAGQPGEEVAAPIPTEAPVVSELGDKADDANVANIAKDTRTAAVAAPAPSTANDANWPSTQTTALSEQRLDTLRGGFDTSQGLKVSFGISRAVYVNGNLVTQTSFNIPDVGAMTAQQAQALLASGGASTLVQNGRGNAVQPGALPPGAMAIQNTLNNQQIQALTSINTSVNSLASYKVANLISSINAALAATVRPR
ncbi:hypothetical protein [Paraburkholderia kururiensis]|uniref:Uncharacterized protein n=1 Tax=Paraburkholderia kururiensis TaxID=984307 RepID=A0ABZ0WPR2_9BURK|nr:hypothetical protein [Paraburkholderia kururiensis]WQD79394.1 hypothetical protein U0042_06750 [Paraburkholderia kururiensis]